MISGIDYGRGNDESCTITFVNPEYIKQLEQENKQLKDNWNKLKEWIKEDTEVAETNFEMGRCFNMYDLLNKMQEIEGGMNE